MLKAAAGRPLKIMLPMVATVEEFRRARDVIHRECAHLEKHDHMPPSELKVGVMVEVPSLLFEIHEIAREADFLSVGTNDLMQFLFAADRENRRVAERFDPLSPGALRALRRIARAAEGAGCPVTICGEVGGRPLEAMALIGLGFRSFSMSPSSLGPVKAMVITLDAGEIKDFIQPMLEMRDGPASLRPALIEFAERRQIAI
jgi:phosphotransferase system enzyme I (PtsP)